MMKTPFRYDFVGSFLRPQRLKDARKDFENGKISVKDHPFVKHFKFVKELEDENTVAKQTIPSLGQFYAYFTGAELLHTTIEIYGSEKAFAEDVIKAYSEFVQEIYAAGCRNLQFDDCV